MGSKSKIKGGGAFGSAGACRHNVRLTGWEKQKKFMAEQAKREDAAHHTKVTVTPYAAPKTNMLNRIFQRKSS